MEKSKLGKKLGQDSGKLEKGRRANRTYDLPTEMNAKDVMRLLNCSRATANRRLTAVRMTHRLPPYTKIPLVLYVAHYKLDLENVVKKLAEKY